MKIMNEDVQSSSNKHVCKEILMAAACNLSVLACGCAVAWPSPAYSFLTTQAEGQVKPLARDTILTPVQFSWCSASMFAAAAVGAPIGATLGRQIGSRWALLTAGAPLVVSWLFLATADRLLHILFGRLLAGVATGFVFTLAPVYTAMIASDKIRGALGSFLQIELCLGVLLVYALGPYVSLQVVGWICNGVTLIYIICFILCEDSPSTGPAANTIESLSRLFCPGSPDNRAFTICALLILTQQGCGINIILMNAQDIFNAGATEGTSGGLSPEISTILIGAVMLIASCFCPLLVDRLGRRPLLLIGCFGQTLCLIALTIYMFYLRKDTSSVVRYQPICQASVMIYVALFAVALGPIPWLVAGEIFKGDVRHVGCSAVSSIAWFISFVLAVSWFYLRTLLGYEAAFGAFATISFGGGLCVLFLLPETRGKSFDQIQTILASTQKIFIRGISEPVSQ